MSVIVHSNTEVGSSTDGLVQAMYQLILNTWEIKNLKEAIEKL
jgi:hypothetical protein